MPDIFTASSAYHGTASAGGVISGEPHFQVCATANINAANQFECSFWVNENGKRVDSDLGNAAYRIRDKAGALVSGLAQASVSPDLNGYYHVTPVSAASIADLNHYILEIEIPVDGVEVASSIGLVYGE